MVEISLHSHGMLGGAVPEAPDWLLAFSSFSLLPCSREVLKLVKDEGQLEIITLHLC